MMFQRILVPLDGSQRAEQAIPLAVRLARASGGSLLFLRIVPPLLMTGMAPYPPVALTYLQNLQSLEEQQWASAQAYLEKSMEASEFAGLDMHAAVHVGPPASVILQVVQEQSIDLVVLCSHGFTGIKRWALGSVAQKVVRHSPVPVFLLREQHLNLTKKVAQPIRALVALDGSSFAEAALLPTAHLVAALSSPAEGALHLLQVMRRPAPEEEREYWLGGLADDVYRAAHRAADESLYSARAALLRELSGKLSVQVDWSVAEGSDIAHTLIQVAEGGKGPAIQRPSDVLGLAAHGRGGIQRWVVGSVAERVLQGSTLPLFLVHPQAPSSSSSEGEASRGSF